MPERDRWRRLAIEWLNRANDDLEVVRLAAGGVGISDAVLGFHAQQAIEKGLKAALAAKMIEPPRTHNLRYLADRVKSLYRLRKDPMPGADFTPWGTVLRYPGADPGDEKLQPEKVLQQVQRCLTLVQSLVE